MAVPLATLKLLVGGGYHWAAPRDDVPVPGPEATPEQVVEACLDAVSARDFATANTIDARPDTDLERFSRPTHTTDVQVQDTRVEGERAHVLFTAEFDGGGGTIEDGPWGYYLERGSDGRHITEAGVARRLGSDPRSDACSCPTPSRSR